MTTAKAKKEQEFVAAGFVGGGEQRERFVFEVTIDTNERAITCVEQSLVDQVHGHLDTLLDNELGGDAIWLQVKLLKYKEKVD